MMLGELGNELLLAIKRDHPDIVLWIFFTLFFMACARYVSKLDGLWGKESRLKKTIFLKGIKEGYLPVMPDFNLMFDKVYGEDPYSPSFFAVSAIISSFVFIILCAVVFYQNSEVLPGKEGIEKILFIMTVAYGAGIISNVPLDYISLLKARRLLKSRLSIRKILVIDIILSIIISFLGCVFLGIAIPFLFSLVSSGGSDVNQAYEALIRFTNAVVTVNTKDPFGIIFFLMLFTSLSTSIWLWLHSLTYATIRFNTFILKLTDTFMIENSPMHVVSMILQIYIIIFSVITYIIFNAASKLFGSLT